MPLLQDIQPNVAAAAEAATSAEKRSAPSLNDDNNTVAKKAKPDDGDDKRAALMALTAKELKDRCKLAGVKCSGNKTQMTDRLLNPTEYQKKKSNTRSTQSVNQALLAAGYANPERASRCTRRGLQKGYLSLENGGLGQVVFSGSCYNCESVMVATLKDLLDQPDYGGHEYEDGASSGALQCEECNVGAYVTGMCDGHLQQDSGKFHNHCQDCPGFGKCLGDYREDHCRDCGQHYFAGNSGFACPCHSERRRGPAGSVMGFLAACSFDDFYDSD